MRVLARQPSSVSANRQVSVAGPQRRLTRKTCPPCSPNWKSLGAIDAGDCGTRLVEDLKKTDPALWPQLLSYFKASLAYRQKYMSQLAKQCNAEDSNRCR